MLNYLLGKYITFAFHEPKKYPKKSYLDTSKENISDVMSDEEMEKRAKYNTLKMGGVIK